MINYVTPESLDFAWAQIEPMIQKGLSHGQGDEAQPEFIKESVRNGLMQMWVVQEEGEISSGIVLSVTQNPNGLKVWVELLAGKDMDSWVDDLEKTLGLFREQVGAMCVEASCRKGLSKYLKKRGWKEKAVIMEMK